MIKYKIRDNTTGLYSTGGHTPRFTKAGKLWAHIGHVKSHLNFFKAIPDSWEIVEIHLMDGSTYSAKSIHTPSKHAYAKLGYGYFGKQVPANLVKGSPEWSEYMKTLMAGG